MKILHVMAGGEVGGAETFFLDGVMALADDGEIKQAVVTRPFVHRKNCMDTVGVKLYPASFNKWFRFPTKRTIKKAIAEFKPDIVQYWMGRAGTYAVKGNHINLAWYGGYYKTQKRFPLCSHHVGVTYDIRRHIVENGGIAPERAGVLHTLANFKKDVKPVNRADHNTPDDAPLLLALARLHWKKGLDVLLKALVDIPSAYLWIAGDGPLWKELNTMARDLGVEERVRFLGWRNDREALLKACDVCVFPSRYEPFGTVTIEAWAMKKPLVVAASQGPAAYVKDKDNGMLVPVDDVAALRDAIKAVLDDTNLAAHIVRGGTRDYEKTFSRDAFVRLAKEFYGKVLRGESIAPDKG